MVASSSSSPRNWTRSPCPSAAARSRRTWRSSPSPTIAHSTSGTARPRIPCHRVEPFDIDARMEHADAVRREAPLLGQEPAGIAAVRHDVIGPMQDPAYQPAQLAAGGGIVHLLAVRVAEEGDSRPG